VKGWFADFLWYGWYEFFPREILWKSVVAVDYEEAGIGRLSPLPDRVFRKGSLIHKALNGLALVNDAIVEYCGRARYIVVKTSYDKAFGHGIRIRLADLDDSQRQQLLTTLRTNVPNALNDPRVLEVLATPNILCD
jgi:hypothetical protein